MKHIYNLIKGAGLMLLMVAGMNSASAQTVSIDYGYDSSLYGYCPTPLHVYYGGGGTTTGYNFATDDMDIQIFWGDGNDTSYSVPLSNGGTYQYFNFWAGHNYYSPGTFTITVIATGVNGTDDTLTYGPLYLSSTCSTIDGSAYVDNNSNCVFDAGDDPMAYANIAAVDPVTGNYLGFGYTNSSGQYSFTVPAGYPVNLILNAVNPSPAGFTTTCPATGQYSFTTTTGTSTYNFGMECTNPQFDLETQGWGWGFVPGLNGAAQGYAWNWGCLPVSGSLTITSSNPLVTFTGNGWGGNPAPNSFTSNSATFNFSNLFVGNVYSWWNAFNGFAEVHTDTTAQIGDSVCFTFTVTPTVGDVNTANNTFTICRPILASWDPNMKEVYPAGSDAAGTVPPNTTFTYTVHFQNTGSYPAADVYIMDTLDADLDMTTMQILGSSHTMNPIFYSNNRVKFDFPNINLIDSTTNEPLSHGWVRYRVAAKTGLALGTEIENTAHIFFDYNPAVVTNTTLNTINIVGVEELNMTENNLYPNPVSDVLNVSFKENVSGRIEVRDVTGRVVYAQMMKNSTQLSLDVSKWNAGMYEINLNGAQLSAKRFIVVR